MKDIEKNNQVLKSILGPDFSTRMIRFPGGHMTWKKKDPKGMAALDAALLKKDYHQVDWNVLTKDAEGRHKKSGRTHKPIHEVCKGSRKSRDLNA